ncbi:MAG: anthranilate phosphoribosyltransferase [Actinomycetota bacterium]|nr:anthranilate phosphoribosyltransferase [Actinomycetota bacterium]MEC7434953.1 anthranilate phosphoribosyltransferase [Actinomycetota bacterium]MEC7666935.1 anthranilate phosphoribosyltransferase [Actinomycetota bacterium]MEC8464046.1 anthranilate phosphoribosyltransferase [Actinomycetota bacterium]MEC8521382.1 anthranilate phosphoribosyltransferase [Actinomycetota bacterium]
MAEIDVVGGWGTVIARVLSGEELDAATIATAVEVILQGDASPAQIAGFLVALRGRGETSSELSAMLDVVLTHGVEVPLNESQRSLAIDVVGTGGDGSHSINVSTMAAIVAAGAGTPVCKHGNRSASSSCGTADVLEELGVNIGATADTVARCVSEAGIGFCFAPTFHPAFRFAGPPRREIGIPTAFNLLGPMANPGRVQRQVIGVADPSRAELVLGTLRQRGAKHVWVVHGNGLDELSTTGPSIVHELIDDTINTFTIDAAEFGLAPASQDDLTGGGPAENAEVVRNVLSGALGAHRDIVVFNAAAALVVAGNATGFGDAIQLANDSIDNGSASAALDALVVASREEPAEH